MSNIIAIHKKYDKIKVCFYFKDLNKASLKNNFPQFYIDILLNNAGKSFTYYFMNSFLGYNQIKMAKEDNKKTTFVTH